MCSHCKTKPYKCHWPGCDKAFARQHNCKRHEQLHSNYRPFVCEGCGKNFARMDVLNRHPRSEAGAECARAVQEKRETGVGVSGDIIQKGGEKASSLNMDAIAFGSMRFEDSWSISL